MTNPNLEPQEFLIIQNLQAAIGAIAVAAGFHYDVAGTAVKLDPNHDVDRFAPPDGPRPFVILQLKPSTWAYHQAGRVQVTLPVTVHWVGESDPTVDASRMLAYLRGCADIERAIALDHTRGGRAVDTRITTHNCDESTAGSQVWAMVEVEILYRHVYGEPDGL